MADPLSPVVSEIAVTLVIIKSACAKDSQIPAARQMRAKVFAKETGSVFVEPLSKLEILRLDEARAFRKA